MKLLLIISSLFLLASCNIQQTQQEKLNKMQECDQLWRGISVKAFDNVSCGYTKEDKVQTCIDKYIDAIDEKYNNPDTVSDLREDDYSNVVRTCNEVFGTREEIQ